MVLLPFICSLALAQPGGLDAGFVVGSGANGTVRCVTLQSDGKILIGGDFTMYNGTVRNGIARLNADGSLDQSFDPGSGTSGWVASVAIDASGKIIVVGSFANWNGVFRYCIARLHPNGALDTTFDPGSGPAQVGTITYLETVHVKADGKLLVGGSFVTFNGLPRSGLVQLNADGSVDTGFDLGDGFANLTTGGQVRSISLRYDGYMVVGGNFSYYDNDLRNNVARLSPNAQLDSYFGSGAGANGTVTTTLLQPDGKTIFGGYFTSFQGAPCGRVARVDLLGDVDAAFSVGSGSNSGITTMALQTDEKIIVGGYFTSFNGASCGRLARLNADGGLDGSFGPGSGANNAVRAVAIQPDGKIVIAGEFTSYDGVTQNRITRVNGGEPLPNIHVRAMLGAAFLPGPIQMTDALRTQALLPMMEPYSGLGYVHVGQGGTSTTASVLANSGPDAIVDWVVLEMRASWNSTVRIASRTALLQCDGDIVDADGQSPVSFDCPAGSYFVAMRHRNHLGVMTASPIALSSSPTTIDFTNAGTPTYGINAQKNVNGTMVLWPGDANFNGTVKYAGSANDRDVVLQVVGGGAPTNTVTNVYHGADINLDGSVKYAGSANDRDIILQTIGGSVPTATRTQQLP